jgi:hypothetical protein
MRFRRKHEVLVPMAPNCPRLVELPYMERDRTPPDVYSTVPWEQKTRRYELNRTFVMTAQDGTQYLWRSCDRHQRAWGWKDSCAEYRGFWPYTVPRECWHPAVWAFEDGQIDAPAGL